MCVFYPLQEEEEEKKTVAFGQHLSSKAMRKEI
jgi:hypothetical protein